MRLNQNQLGMLGNGLIGGRRMRMRMRGKGKVWDFIKKHGKRALDLGKKGYELSQNPQVRGLFKHALKTFKTLKGEGRRRRGIGIRRAKGITCGKGLIGGMTLANNQITTPGPLP